MTDLRTGNAPPELIIGLGLLSAALFMAVGVSIFLPGVEGIGLACMSTFWVGFASHMARNVMGRRLKNAVIIGLVVGAAASILYIRWQTVELENHANVWSFYVLPVALVAGRMFSTSRWAAWFVDTFRAGEAVSTESAATPGRADQPEIWVARSASGDYFVFDPAIQPSNGQEHIYYYDLSAHRVKRIHKNEVSKEFTAVDEPSIRIGCIKEYRIWKASFGEEAIREIIAEAERNQQ
ncbi:MAG TPA: hypothetical protein VN376_02255 [Longilinea sp.]|nr:hypothetical protein [Longilinea sp.]